MTGGGQPDCGFVSPSEIRAQWPKLKYLPRPEPPRDWRESWETWRKEYESWKPEQLACSNNKGYFCRGHGLWITCDEISLGEADSHVMTNPRCPERHFKLDIAIEEQHAEIEAAAARAADTAPEAAYPSRSDEYSEQDDDPGLHMDQLSIGPDQKGKTRVGSWMDYSEDPAQDGLGHGFASMTAGDSHLPPEFSTSPDDFSYSTQQTSSLSKKEAGDDAKGRNKHRKGDKSSSKSPESQTKSGRAEWSSHSTDAAVTSGYMHDNPFYSYGAQQGLQGQDTVESPYEEHDTNTFYGPEQGSEGYQYDNTSWGSDLPLDPSHGGRPDERRPHKEKGKRHDRDKGRGPKGR